MYRISLIYVKYSTSSHEICVGRRPLPYRTVSVPYRTVRFRTVQYNTDRGAEGARSEDRGVTNDFFRNGTGKLPPHSWELAETFTAPFGAELSPLRSICPVFTAAYDRQYMTTQLTQHNL